MKKQIKDICEILDSQRIPITAKNRKSGNIPYYGANGVQDYVEDYIFDDELVLVAEDGGNFGSKTKPIAYRVSGKCWVNNHAHVLKPKEMVDVDYLCYSLMFYDTTDIIHGATRQKLNQADLQKMEIPLPSLPEQQKIAAHLDSIQSAIDNKKQQLQQLDELVKSKFVEMFGDVKEQVSIKEICDVFGGYSFKSGDISENSGIRILQIGNVALNDVSWEVTNYLPKDFEKKHESFLLKKDDIVMALTRPIIQSLGNVKTCLVKSTDLPCLLNQRVGKIRAKFGTNIRFVYYCFMQHSFTDYVQSCCKGSSQPNMSTKDIENYEIPKVDENLQNTFAEYVQKIDSAKSIIKTQLVDLQELLDSKMDEYFGE